MQTVSTGQHLDFSLAMDLEYPKGSELFNVAQKLLEAMC